MIKERFFKHLPVHPLHPPYASPVDDIQNQNKYSRIFKIFLDVDLYIERNHELAILELERSFSINPFIDLLGYIKDVDDETHPGN